MEENNDKNLMSENMSDEKLSDQNVSSENETVENVSAENESGKRPPKKQKKRFNLFNPFGNRYRRIRTEEERRKKSVLLGWLAILFSFLCIGLCYPCVWLGVKGVVYGFSHYLGIFTMFLAMGNIFIIIFSIAAMFIPFYFWLQGIRLVILQFLLNRRYVSWLALLVWIGSFVTMFVLTFDSIAHFAGIGTMWFFK